MDPARPDDSPSRTPRAACPAGERRASGSPRLDLACLLVLLAVVLVPFRGALVGDRVMLAFDTRLPGMAPFQAEAPPDVEARPANLVTSDINGWIVPELELTVREIRAGRLPLWNPYVLAGQPLLANLAFAPFYPPNALAYVMDPLRALAWITVLHFWLAGAFLFLFLRRVGVAPAAAFAGALAGAFASWLTVRFHLPSTVATAAWTFALLLAAENLARRPGVKNAAALALAVACAFLAGFPQLAVLQLVCTGIYLLTRVLAPGVQRRVAVLSVAGVAVAAGALASAIQSFPAFALYRGSLRQAWADPALQADRGLRPAALIGALLPEFFSAPTRADLMPAVHSQHLPHRLLLGADVQENPVENALWPGALALALAAAALTRARRCAVTRALLVVVLAGLLLSSRNPLARVLLEHVPWLAAGNPKRALLLVCLPLAALAGLGVQVLAGTRDAGARRARAAAILTACVSAAVLAAAQQAPVWLDPSRLAHRLGPGVTEVEVAAFLAYLRDTTLAPLLVAVLALLLLLVSAVPFARNPWGRRAFALLSAILIGADLVPFAVRFNPLQERAGQYPRTPAVDLIASSGERSARFREARLLPGLIGPYFAYRSLEGGEPLVLRRTGELFEALEPGRFDRDDPRVARAFEDPRTFTHPLFLRLASPWIVTNVPLPESIGAQLAYAGEREGVGIYRLPAALPRVRLCAGYEVVRNVEERLELLRDPRTDPERVVLLERDPGLGMPRGARPKPENDARIVAETPARLEIEVDPLQQPALLVVADSQQPGWRATCTVGDEERDAEVMPADHALRAVALPAGTRRVVMEYFPDEFVSGAWTSLLAFVAIACAAALPRLARRGRPGLNRAPAVSSAN